MAPNKFPRVEPSVVRALPVARLRRARFQVLVGLLFLGSVLAACGSAPEAPTPLPTAVPPASDRSPGIWTVPFRYEFPPGIFGQGEHRYAFLIHCPIIQSEDITTEWFHFVVSDEVLPQPEPIYLRLQGLSADPFNPTYVTNNVIHPERPVIAIVYLVGLPKPAADLAAGECEVLVFWDAVGRQALTVQEPILP